MEKILLIDDDKDILRLLSFYIRKLGFKPIEYSDSTEISIDLVNSLDPHIIILDLKMPQKSGLEILKELSPLLKNTPILILTAHGTIETAVEAMKYGAYDFIVKPIDITRLSIVVKNAIKSSMMSRKIMDTENNSRKSYCGIIGSDKKMQKIYDTIDLVAESNSTIMITGESGTGKELVAQAIHKKSKRQGDIVEVNCGAIPEDLMESELFGHEKGAFTGATESRPGTIELSNNGTLFLDEICELKLALQVKLLRFLQERYVVRVGGNKKIFIDTRIVSATKKDPAEEIEKGNFRDDLYYRLNVLEIRLPALRERKSDIPALSRHFLNYFSEKNNKSFTSIDENAMSILTSYNWPGNIRELINTIERCVILNNNDVLSENMLPGDIVKNHNHSSQTITFEDEIIPFEEVKKRVFNDALNACDGNVVMAAKKLGIGYNTLYRKIREYNIKI